MTRHIEVNEIQLDRQNPSPVVLIARIWNTSPPPSLHLPSLRLRDSQNDPTSLLGGWCAFGIGIAAFQSTFGDPQYNLDFPRYRGNSFQGVVDGFRFCVTGGSLAVRSNVLAVFGGIEIL